MQLTRNGFPRVVITGIGAMTPLGDADQTWKSIKAGQSGIRRIQSFDPSELDVQIAGEVPIDPQQYLDPKEARRLARSTQLVMVATQMALDDAGLTTEMLADAPERVGVSVGTTEGGYELASRSNIQFDASGRRPRPLELANALTNMPAHYVSRVANARGPMTTVSGACASGTMGVGEGLRFMREGRADVMLAGGVEALIEAYIIAGLTSMTVLAKGYNDNPTAASRPFDADRSGFVYSEGAGMLVLETLEHALARDANIYGEFMGYGVSSDAYHISAPDPTGEGPANAMRWALDNAYINADAVDYINAHGTSTELNDKTETLAIKLCLGEHAYEIPVSSTKSMIGHCLGASGAVEAVVCVKALHDNVVPPTINLETPDPECDLDYVPNEARDADLNVIMSNSFGFGGANACVVFGKL